MIIAWTVSYVCMCIRSKSLHMLVCMYVCVYVVWQCKAKPLSLYNFTLISNALSLLFVVVLAQLLVHAGCVRE